MNWEVTTRAWQPPSRLGQKFNAVPSLVSSLDGQKPLQGSGFFVHPAIVATAGHVVAFDVNGSRQYATEIRFSCGRYDGVAASVALPAGFMAKDPAAQDIALLWVGRSCCKMEEALLIGALEEGTNAAGRIWGWAKNLADQLVFDDHDVPDAARDGAAIRYTSPNLPGFSGGPLLVPPGVADGSGTAVGFHDFHDDRGGQAVPLDLDDLIDGMKALGF